MSAQLVAHFSYLVDDAHRALLSTLMGSVKGMKFENGTMKLLFEDDEVLSATAAGADPGADWPDSFRDAVKFHALHSFPDESGFALVLGDHGNYEGAEKSPLRDFADWWVVDAQSGRLSFVSHEGGGPKKPVPASAGVMFVRRVAESLGLPLPELKEPVKRVVLAATPGAEAPKLEVQELVRENVERKDVQALAFLANGTKLLAAYEDATITVWDVASGRAVETWTPSSDDRKPVGDVGFKLSANGFMSFESLTVSRDEKSMLTTHGNSGGAQLWSLSPITLLGALPGGGTPYAPAAFSADGSLLLAKVGRTVWQWKREDRSIVHQGSKYDDGSTELAAFSPDGSLVAYLADDFDVRVVDTATQAEVVRIDAEHETPYSNKVESICFSTDGKHVITGDIVGQIRTFDARSGAPVSAFSRAEGRDGRVVSLATSAETIVAGYDWDGVDLWSTSGNFVGTSDAKARVVAIAPDGVTFATGDSKGVVSLRREGGPPPPPSAKDPAPKPKEPAAKKTKKTRKRAPAPKAKKRTGRGRTRSAQSKKRPGPSVKRGGARRKR